MGRFELGIVLPNMQFGPDRTTARWPEMRAMAIRAEGMGFDTMDEVAPRLASLEAICAELGRDPQTIGWPVGVSVRPLEAAGFSEGVISGSPDEIAEAFRSFRDAGFTQLEIMFGPGTMEALDALAPVVESIQAD